MQPVALLVVIAWLGVSAWAWRSASGRQMAEQFVGIWRLPWGKQAIPRTHVPRAAASDSIHKASTICRPKKST